MEIKLKRIDDAYKMIALNENGRQIEMDGSEAIGGQNSAMRPMQVLLSAVGGCSSIDVISLLKKFRQPLKDIQVTLTGDREPGKVPSLFTDINIHYDLYGDIDPAKAEKAITLSVEKYCSVSLMLRKETNITWSYKIFQ